MSTAVTPEGEKLERFGFEVVFKQGRLHVMITISDPDELRPVTKHPVMGPIYQALSSGRPDQLPTLSEDPIERQKLADLAVYAARVDCGSVTHEPTTDGSRIRFCTTRQSN